MDGLCRAIGAAIPCPVAGKTYLLRPLRLIDIGTIEFAILSHRRTPLEQVQPGVEKLPEHLRQKVVDMALADTKANFRRYGRVRAKEFHDYLFTGRGIVLCLWLCLCTTQGPVFACREEAAAVYRKMTDRDKAEFVRRRDMVSGIDLISQLDWPESSVSIKTDYFTPWRKMIAEIASEWNIGEDVVSQWTLYQFKLHTTPKEELGGVVFEPMTVEQAKLIQAQHLKRQKELAAKERNGAR